MVVIPPIFWCINKKFGFRLLVISTLVAYIATVIKNLIRLPRPDAHLWKTQPVSYAFPSGHAYGTTTFWLYIMHFTRRKFYIIFGFAIIALVSLSRIYLGVHYPGDVLAGIALGICTIALFIFVEPKITAAVISLQFQQKIIFAIIPPFLLFIYGSLFFHIDDRGVQLSGALLGIIPGYVLEDEYIRITTEVPINVKVMRTIVGLFIAFIAYFGLGMVLPYNIGTCLFTAWLGGFSVIFIAPWMFSKVEKLKF
jgi:hypothetical protein